MGAGGEAALRKLGGDFFHQPAGVRARREPPGAQETDAVNLAGLRVRGGREEERGGDDGDKAMHLHSITSSAVARRLVGTVRPIDRAALTLTMNSNSSGC